MNRHEIRIKRRLHRAMVRDVLHYGIVCLPESDIGVERFYVARGPPSGPLTEYEPATLSATPRSALVDYGHAVDYLRAADGPVLAVHNHPEGRPFPAPADLRLLRILSEDAKRPVPGFILGYTGSFVRAARRILAATGDDRLTPEEKEAEASSVYRELLHFAAVPAKKWPERAYWPVQPKVGRTRVVEAVLDVYRTRPEDFGRAFQLDDEAEDGWDLRAWRLVR
ncbi:MAG: hypothetical protein L6R43_00620 [Planctomycetes bacterium]|nr:hypothetical protein [Planctomycetota bacterium]